MMRFAGCCSLALRALWLPEDLHVPHPTLVGGSFKGGRTENKSGLCQALPIKLFSVACTCCTNTQSRETGALTSPSPSKAGEPAVPPPSPSLEFATLTCARVGNTWPALAAQLEPAAQEQEPGRACWKHEVAGHPATGLGNTLSHEGSKPCLKRNANM